MKSFSDNILPYPALVQDPIFSLIIFLLLVSLILNLKLGQWLWNACRIKSRLHGMIFEVHRSQGQSLTSSVTHPTTSTLATPVSIPGPCLPYSPLGEKTVLVLLFVLRNVLLVMWARVPRTRCQSSRSRRFRLQPICWSHHWPWIMSWKQEKDLPFSKNLFFF